MSGKGKKRNFPYFPSKIREGKKHVIFLPEKRREKSTSLKGSNRGNFPDGYWGK